MYNSASCYKNGKFEFLFNAEVYLVVPFSGFDYSKFAFGGLGSSFTVTCTVETYYAIKKSYWTFDGQKLESSVAP